MPQLSRAGAKNAAFAARSVITRAAEHSHASPSSRVEGLGESRSSSGVPSIEVLTWVNNHFQMPAIEVGNIWQLIASQARSMCQ